MSTNKKMPKIALDNVTRLSLLQRVKHRTTAQHYQKLKGKEYSFMEQMKDHLNTKNMLTEKQLDWLLSILERTEKEIAAEKSGKKLRQ